LRIPKIKERNHTAKFNLTSDLFQTNVTINLVLPGSLIQVYFSFRMEVKIFSVTGEMWMFLRLQCLQAFMSGSPGEGEQNMRRRIG